MRSTNTCLLLLSTLTILSAATINQPTPPTDNSTALITLDPVEQDIDRFLRKGYKQLSDGVLIHIRVNESNYLLAYLVSNGSLFVFSTEYISGNHSLRIKGVLQLTATEGEDAAGIRFSPNIPRQNGSNLIAQTRVLLTPIDATPKQVNAAPAKKRSFLEQLAGYDFGQSKTQKPSSLSKADKN